MLIGDSSKRMAWEISHFAQNEAVYLNCSNCMFACMILHSTSAKIMQNCQINYSLLPKNACNNNDIGSHGSDCLMFL